jgi:hypothetical protein
VTTKSTQLADGFTEAFLTSFTKSSVRRSSGRALREVERTWTRGVHKTHVLAEQIASVRPSTVSGEPTWAAKVARHHL